MRDIFSKLIDHPVMLFLSKAVDLFFLNMMFLITCLPLFTIGSALTALYYVCVTDWDTQNAHLVSRYFKSFKDNFGQSFILWCIMLCSGSVVGGITLIAFTGWRDGHSTPMAVFLVVCAILVLVYVCIFTYVWPLQAKFTNTVGNTLKNAFLMSVSNLPGTVISWMLLAAVMFLSYQVGAVRVMAILFGFSFIAYMQSKIFRSVFEPYFAEAEEQEYQKLQEEIAIDMAEKEKARKQEQEEMFARLDELKAAQAEETADSEAEEARDSYEDAEEK